MCFCLISCIELSTVADIWLSWLWNQIQHQEGTILKWGEKAEMCIGDLELCYSHWLLIQESLSAPSLNWCWSWEGESGEREGHLPRKGFSS